LASNTTKSAKRPHEDGTPPSNDTLREDTDFLRALLDVHQQLEFSELLRVLVSHVASWTGAESAFGLGPGAERTWIVPLASTVEPGDARYRAFTRLDPEKVRGWLSGGVERCEGFGPLASNLKDWPGEKPDSCLALPIQGTSGEWSGFLLAVGPTRHDAATLRRIEALVEGSRPAVAHAVQLLAMRELVIKDDTAHCFNRRYFEEFVPEELSRASRFRAPLSLIFLDMDNLKQVNNLHGHAMGSCTLMEVSRRIRGKIRKFDRLFRYGGDEFCILLPETEWHGAMEVAQRVREAISGHDFLEEELGGQGIGMTASLGIASYPLHARNQQDLIRQADRAMQEIKSAGKDSIGVAKMIGEQT
jgi:diguanylate cyclase (GGDEF)-like protein